MGNCQDCSRKSIAFDELLANEAKREHQREKLTVSVFNNIIGHYIYQTLIDEEYEYIEDILYDLDCYQSNIISIASHNIKNNKLNKHKWTDNDKEILYKLLSKIFKNNISDIDILVNECTLSLAKCNHKQLIDNVENIITNIYTVEIQPETELINAKVTFL